MPLAPVLADGLLVPLGVATCALAVLALVLRLTSGVAPCTVTGTGAGALLTGCALGSLIAAMAQPLARRPDPARRRHNTTTAAVAHQLKIFVRRSASPTRS